MPGTSPSPCWQLIQAALILGGLCWVIAFVWGGMLVIPACSSAAWAHAAIWVVWPGLPTPRLLAVDAAGWQVIIVETVGVGQSELEIAMLAGVTIVVLTPAAGDTVQTLKAGLLEVADLFVVNKSDLPGASRLVRDLRAMLSHGGTQDVAIVQTEATTGHGIRDLWEAMEARVAGHDPAAAARRHALAIRRVQGAALAVLADDLPTVAAAHDAAYAALLDQVVARTLDPITAARRLLSWWHDAL